MNLYTELYYEYDEINLEALVENAASTSVELVDVCVKPSENYTCKKVDKLASGRLIYPDGTLNPNDKRIYLFNFTMNGHQQIYQESVIGLLEIRWKTANEERSQEWPLVKEASTREDYILSVAENPAKVKFHQEFGITFRLTNCSNRETTPSVHCENFQNRSILWLGVSGRRYGPLKPFSSILIPCRLFPVESGLQTLPEIQIFDAQLGKSYIFNNLAHVYVEDAKSLAQHN